MSKLLLMGHNVTAVACSGFQKIKVVHFSPSPFNYFPSLKTRRIPGKPVMFLWPGSKALTLKLFVRNYKSVIKAYVDCQLPFFIPTILMQIVSYWLETAHLICSLHAPQRHPPPPSQVYPPQRGMQLKKRLWSWRDCLGKRLKCLKCICRSYRHAGTTGAQG